MKMKSIVTCFGGDNKRKRINGKTPAELSKTGTNNQVNNNPALDGNPGSSSGISDNVVEETSKQETPEKGEREGNQVTSVKPPRSTVAGHGYGLRSTFAKGVSGLEKAAVNLRPTPASSSNIDKKKPEVGVTSSGPSTSSSKRTKIDTGKAKVGETISGFSTKSTKNHDLNVQKSAKPSGVVNIQDSVETCNPFGCLENSELEPSSFVKEKSSKKGGKKCNKPSNLKLIGATQIDLDDTNRSEGGSVCRGEKSRVMPTNTGKQQNSVKIIDKGKAKVGVTISKPQKITPAVQKGKNQIAKGVTVSEPKTGTNPGLQEQEKGNKVETSSRTTQLPIKPPSKANDYEPEPEPEPEPDPEPVYHITWDGCDDESETLPGETCFICEKSLSSLIPKGRGSRFLDDEYDYYFEQTNLPEVSVLGCGHFYHAQCLESITPNDQRTDPPCYMCFLLDL